MNITELYQDDFLNYLLELNDIKKRDFSALPDFRKKVNALLENTVQKNINALIALSEEKVVRENFFTETDIGFLLLAILIYKEEQRIGYSVTIFSNFHSLDELVLLLTHFKFLLWRMEFNTDQSNGKDFISFINTHTFSPECVEILTENLAFQKFQMLRTLMFLFHENGMDTYTQAYIKALEQHIHKEDTTNE